MKSDHGTDVIHLWRLGFTVRNDPANSVDFRSIARGDGFDWSFVVLCGPASRSGRLAGAGRCDSRQPDQGGRGVAFSTGSPFVSLSPFLKNSSRPRETRTYAGALKDFSFSHIREHPNLYCFYRDSGLVLAVVLGHDDLSDQLLGRAPARPPVQVRDGC